MKNCLPLAMVFGWCAAACWAVDWNTYRPAGYVSDFAKVVEGGSRTRLEVYCAAVQQATGARLALVTLPSIEGEPAADVARLLFRAWDLGNQGALLLLVTEDHVDRLEVGDGLKPVLAGGMADRVLAAMRPALRQKDYGDALAAAAGAMGDTIAQAKHVRLSQHLARRIQPGFFDRFLPWPVLAGCLLLLLWLMRTGALFPRNPLARATWGSNGSGGFGGYDSGDSFGGFGGGDSGRGRAATDW